MTIDIDALRPRLQAAVGDALQVGEVLGVGGFAAVFRARDPFLERDVAIKVLDPTLALSEELEDQFLREARIVAGVEHPHIVPLYDAAVKGGLLFLVMRLLPGQSLADRIKVEGKMAPAEAARLAHEVAMALAAAHERGVVHRDIKPDNILLDASGHATVTDFGISRVTGRPAGEQAGVTIGTPNYMSPEQAMGEDVDGRADTYSLGVVLFEMLTGKLPFEGRNFAELMAKVISAPAPKVASLESATPTALVRIVEQLLAKERDQRPDATTLVKLLAAARTPDALLTPSQAKWRTRRRRLLMLGLVGGTAALVLAFIGRAGFVFLRFAFTGEDPTIITDSTQVPRALIDAARREGSLLPGESVRFAFIPGGRTMDDAMLVIDSFIVRRTPQGARRVNVKHGDISVFAMKPKPPAEQRMRGCIVFKRDSTHTDTLYNDLSGFDLTRLGIALYANRGKLKGVTK